jgi:tRNA(Ile2) C34 agmatinyltransferase TiaS
VNHEVPKLDPAFTQELKRVFADRRAHCPRCGYDLCGVPGPRCPECGKNIRDLLRIADTTPWRLPEMRRRALAVMLLRRFGLLAAVACSIAAIGWSLSQLAR